MNLPEQQDRRNRELDAARRISEALFKHLRVEELGPQALNTALEVVDC
jgi:hypothetical protein